MDDIDNTGAAAYISQEVSSNDYTYQGDGAGSPGENSGYIDTSYDDFQQNSQHDDLLSNPNSVNRGGHSRPSDEELKRMIKKSREEQSSQTQQTQMRSSHARPSDEDVGQMKPSSEEIEQMKIAQKQAYRTQQPHSSHSRPSNDMLVRSMYNSSTGTDGSQTQEESQDDKSLVMKYFPGVSDVYQFDENGSIISAADISFSERRNLKRTVCGHW